jgi:hypothetical protein
MDDKMVEWLFKHPLSDGGQFTGVSDIIEKYGLVPKSAMVETFSSENTGKMSSLIGLKLKEFGLQLREAAAAGAKPAELEKIWIAKVREIAGEAAERDRNFVAETVHERVTRLRRETVEVQTLAAAAIQQYFARHPDRLDDPAIRRLIGRITPSPPERVTAPACGARSPMMIRSRVVLPPPEGPIMTRAWTSGSSMEISSSTRWPL